MGLVSQINVGVSLDGVVQVGGDGECVGSRIQNNGKD